MEHKRLVSVIVIALSVVILASCSKRKPTPTLVPFTSDTIPILNPVSSNYEMVDCAAVYNQPADQPGQLPSFDNSNDTDDDSDSESIQCGYLTVPEDRSLPDSPTIKLAVTIYMSSSTSRKPDPLVIVGSANSLGRGGYFGSPGSYTQMAPDRDVIMVSARGMGRSQPAYSCAQYSDLSVRMTTGNFTLLQWEQAYIEATRACRAQLESSGIILSVYTSASIAADLEDLRQTLGYSQWNIYASSYGTRIALSMMRDYPETLRSVVLDSPWPLQVDTYAEQAAGAVQVLDRLFQYCAEDEQCNQYYPLLKDYFYEDIDALNARPITVPTANLTSGAQMDIVFDGNKLLEFVLSTLSSSRMEQLYEMPRMIYQLHEGKVEVISQLLGQSSGSMRFSGAIDQLIQCNDEFYLSTLGAGVSTNQDMDIHIRKYFETVVDANRKACEIWKTNTPATANTATITSNVATLLLAGEFNWRIPAAWASLTAQTLGHAYVVEFSGTGQAISSARGFSDCSAEVVRAFMTDPEVQPDSQCASMKPNFIWITLP